MVEKELSFSEQVERLQTFSKKKKLELKGIVKKIYVCRVQIKIHKF